MLVEDSDKFLRPLTPKDVEKPAEWSEEDEVNKTCILELLEDRIKDVDGVSYAKRLHTAQNWFKSLPKRFNLQSKQEWSDEDADMLNCCISSIEEAKENRYAYKETDGDTSYDREIDLAQIPSSESSEIIGQLETLRGAERGVRVCNPRLP